MVVLPIDFKATLFHLLAEIFPAGCGFPAVHDCQGNVLNIALDLAFLGLLQQLVGFFLESGRFLSLLSVKGFALFGDMQPLFQTKAVGLVFHILQVCLALLELVPVLKAHTIHYEMGVNVFPVLVGGYQHFKPFPFGSFRCQSASDPVRLLRIYLFFRGKALYKVLVSPALGLAP